MKLTTIDLGLLHPGQLMDSVKSIEILSAEMVLLRPTGGASIFGGPATYSSENCRWAAVVHASVELFSGQTIDAGEITEPRSADEIVDLFDALRTITRRDYIAQFGRYQSWAEVQDYLREYAQ